MPTPTPTRRRLQITPDPGCVQHCQVCGGWNLPGCRACKACDAHCTCKVPCDWCRKPHRRSLCPKCKACRISGCKCKAPPGGIPLKNYLASQYRGSIDLPIRGGVPTRCTAIELELSAYSGNATEPSDPLPKLTRCHAGRDGSIRGDRPMELDIGPIPGVALAKTLDALELWITKHTASVNETCGMHVHVDTSDFKAFELRRLLQLYRVLEPTFYNLVAPSRKTGSYCKVISPEIWRALEEPLRSTGDSETVRRGIRLAWYGEVLPPDPTPLQLGEAMEKVRGRAKDRYAGNRYTGLNLHSHFHRGTVEFRHHQGCVDVPTIRGWVGWCQWFVELAARLTDKEVSGIRSLPDYLMGVWKRPEGPLFLPKDVVAWVEKGLRAPAPPVVPPPPPHSSLEYTIQQMARDIAGLGISEQVTNSVINATVQAQTAATNQYNARRYGASYPWEGTIGPIGTPGPRGGSR